jgi:hypothetical protein
MKRTQGTAPLTVISTVRGWWAIWLLWLNWRIVRARNRIGWPVKPVRKLLKLSFIHFAHWSVFDRVPPGRPRRRARLLPYNYLAFQTNFDGLMGEYIEAFSLVVPVAMREIWGGAYGVPHPKPVAPFLAYIESHQAEAIHGYSAYPEATTKMITSALGLKSRFEAFQQAAQTLAPEQFAAAWGKFLGDVQRML